MATNTPDVRVRLSADGVDEVVRAFQQVAAAAKKSGKDAASGLKPIEAALGGIKDLLPAITVGAAVVGLTALVKGALDTADAIGKLSQKTGVSTENLSALRIAATLTDTSFETVSKSVEKFDKTMGELDQGSATAGASVRRLFGSAQALNGLNTDQRLEKVIDAIAKMGDGYLKTKAAQDFFGKGGAELLPLIDSLGEGGFDKLKEKAQEFGLALDSETTAAATRAKEAMALLKLEVQGAATQFVAGFAPAVEKSLEALEQATGGDGTNGFKKLGEYAGDVAKGITAAFIVVGGAVAVIVANMTDAFDQFFEGVKDGATGITQLFQKNFTGAVASFKQALSSGAKGAGDLLGLRQSDQAQQIQADTQRQLAALYASPDTTPTPKKAASGGGDQDAAAAKARLALLEARLENELALYKSSNAKIEAANENLYKQGLESINQYFAARTEIINNNADEEISVLTRQRALVAKTPTDNKAEEIKRQQDLEKIDAQIAEVQNQRQQQLSQNDKDRNEANFTAQQKTLEAEKQIQEAQGDTYDAAIDAIKKQAAELTKAGVDPSTINKLTSVLTAQANFKQTQQNAGLAETDLGIQQQTIQNQVDAGKLFPTVAAEEYREKVIAILPQSQSYAAALRASAVSPEEIQSGSTVSTEDRRAREQC